MNTVIILSAKYLFVLSILLYFYAFWRLEEKLRKKFIIFSVISFVLSYAVAKISGHFIYDPRPFVVEHVKPLIPHVADNGFPSDHMLLTMAIASVVFVYNKKLGIILAVVAVLVGTSRVLARVHHTEDILGSVVIAIAVTYLVYFLLKLKSAKQHKNG